MNEQLQQELAQVIYDSMENQCTVKTVHSSDNEKLSIDIYKEGHSRDSAGMIKQYIESNWYFESDTFPAMSLVHLFNYAASKDKQEQREIAYTLNLDIRDTLKLFKSSHFTAGLALSILNDTSIDLIRRENESQDEVKYIDYLSRLVLLVSQKCPGINHAQALANYLEKRQESIKNSEHQINLCETLVNCYPYQIEIFKSIDIVRDYLQANNENNFALLPVEKTWSMKIDLQKWQHLFLLPSWTISEYSQAMHLLMKEVEKQSQYRGVEDILMKEKDSNNEYQYSVIIVNTTEQCDFSQKDLLNIMKASFDYLKETNTVFSLDIYKNQGKGGEQREDVKKKFANIVKKIMLYQKITDNLSDDDNEESHYKSPKLKI